MFPFVDDSLPIFCRLSNSFQKLKKVYDHFLFIEIRKLKFFLKKKQASVFSIFSFMILFQLSAGYVSILKFGRNFEKLIFLINFFV